MSQPPNLNWTIVSYGPLEGLPSMFPKKEKYPEDAWTLGGNRKKTLGQTILCLLSRKGPHILLKVSFTVTTGDVRPRPQDGKSIGMKTQIFTWRKTLPM